MRMMIRILVRLIDINMNNLNYKKTNNKNKFKIKWILKNK